MTSVDDEGFTVVKRKVKKPSKSFSVKINKNDVVGDLRTILSEFAYSHLIVSSFLYGSTARNEHKSTSDIDVLIILRCDIHDEDMYKLLTKLMYHFGRKIDLVFMIYKRKLVEEDEERNKIFIDNVVRDAVYLIGKEKDPFVIRMSELIGLYKPRKS